MSASSNEQREYREDGNALNKKVTGLPLPTVEPSPDFLAEMAAVAKAHQPLDHAHTSPVKVSKSKSWWQSSGLKLVGAAAAVVVLLPVGLSVVNGDETFGSGDSFSSSAQDSGGASAPEAGATSEDNSFTKDSGYSSRYNCDTNGECGPSSTPVPPVDNAKRATANKAVRACSGELPDLLAFFACSLREILQ